MSKKYYEIKESKNGEVKERKVAVNYGGHDGIESVDPIDEWGLGDEDAIQYILKEAMEGERETQFDFDCDWTTVKMADMMEILREIGVTSVTRPYSEKSECPFCGHKSFRCQPVEGTDIESCQCDECGRRFIGVYGN